MMARDERVLAAWLVLLGILTVLLLWAAVYCAQRQAVDCAHVGGHIGFAGHFIMVWQVTDYKTGQGIMTQQPLYECIIP